MKLTDAIIVSTDVVAREVGEETMLLDLASGTYFGLDPVGARFWQLLEDGETPAAAHETMAGEYDVEADRLKSDLEGLLAELETNGLIRAA